MFVGVPVAMFVFITLVVLRFTIARVPDGLARAAEQQDGDDPRPEEEDDIEADSQEE